MIDGVLYSSNGIGLVEAFHPGTGKTLWVQQPYPDEPDGGLRGTSTRGLAYWSDGERTTALRDSRRVSDRARSGDRQARRDVGTERPRQPASRARTTGDELLVEQRAAGLPRRRDGRRADDRRAADARSSRRATCRRSTCGPASHAGRSASFRSPGEVGNETWENDSWAYSGQANLWSLISADEELGLAYLPLTSATNDMYGGHRLGDNLFANSLVCVRVRDRRTRLALPDRPSRSLGLRSAGGAGARRHHRRRPADQGRRPGHEAGVRVRVRSHERPTGVAHRGTTRAAVRHARRADLAARSRFPPNRRRSIGRASRSTT